MLRSLLPIAVCLSALTATPAISGEIKGVVELFTSQGCSSCPPADAVLSRLIDEGDVLALAYHVDYWNYLGWKDTLSDAAYTARQYGYARTWGDRGVYTPQAVVNGRDHTNGADRPAIRSLIRTLNGDGKGLKVNVDMRMSDEGLEVGIGEGSGKADVVAVYFDEENTVDIARGENTGRKITYRHSVRDMETIGMWDGKAMTLALPKSVLAAHPGRGCAILLQAVSDDGTPAAILGAAIIDAEEGDGEVRTKK